MTRIDAYKRIIQLLKGFSNSLPINLVSEPIKKEIYDLCDWLKNDLSLEEKALL